MEWKELAVELTDSELNEKTENDTVLRYVIHVIVIQLKTNSRQKLNVCLLVYLSVLYAAVVITCVCQFDTIEKLADDDDVRVRYLLYTDKVVATFQ